MLLIARRYLFSTKSHSVVNLIAWVSLISLLLPVAAVIVLLSIFNGFGALVGGLESAAEGDLTIRPRDSRSFIMAQIDSTALREVKGVRQFSFLTDQTLMIEHKGNGGVLTLRGVDANYTDVVAIEEYINVGKFETAFGDMERIVLGHSMASKLGIRSLHDIAIEIYALKSGRLYSLIGGATHSQAKAHLAGIVMMDQESEQRYGYVSQRLLNSLLGSEGEATQLSIRVKKGESIDQVRSDIEKIIGPEYRIESRQELNPAMYQIIRYEKLGILLICSFVMLLASFTLLGAMAMLIIEKRDDIETLRAMGATRDDIKRIFLMEGAIISGVAIVLGVIVGVGVTLLQQYFGFVQLPSTSMLATAYPVELQLGDVVAVTAIASIIALALSLMVVNGVLRKRLNIDID